MKIVTFTRSNTNGRYRIGSLVSDAEIVDLTNLVSDSDLSPAEVLSCFDLDHGFCDEARLAVERGNLPILSFNAVGLAAPVPRPGKVICIGLNYRDYAAESGRPIPPSPIIFSKFSSCVTASGASINPVKDQDDPE